MRFYRILTILFLVLFLAACKLQTAPVQSVETRLPEVSQAEQIAGAGISSSEDRVNIVSVYGLSESSRVVLSVLHLASGEEQSAYQPVTILEDTAVIGKLVNSLNQPFESQAAARCPAKGLLSFYAGEDLISEFGLGCELEDVFFLSDLHNGQHYKPSADFLEILQELLAQASAE